MKIGDRVTTGSPTRPVMKSGGSCGPFLRPDACRRRGEALYGVWGLFLSLRPLGTDWRKNNGEDHNSENEINAREQGRSGLLRTRGANKILEGLHLANLPLRWSWIQNHRLAVDVSNAICAGPFGTIFKAKDFRDEGVPIVFLRHVGEGEYLDRKPTFMDRSVWERQHQPYSIYGGELLVTNLGDPPGTACIYPSSRGIAMVTPDVMKMTVDNEVADARYLMHFFNSPICKTMVQELAFGLTRSRIDLTMFKAFPIPLAPALEQSEVVHRIEAAFGWIDRLVSEATSARKLIDHLDQALLAKAFRGELVPQDPDDEPATALLERIRAERAVVPKATGAKQTPRTPRQAKATKRTLRKTRRAKSRR